VYHAGVIIFLKGARMGITLIEQIGIVAGIFIGVSGFIYSVLQARHQRMYEREQAAEQREQAAKQQEQAAKQAEEQALKDRLYFLANLIVDKDIPRSSRQIFFDEYIAKGGNGSFVKHWYNEEKELEAKKGRMNDGEL
jgi:type II secretory pathway pseudopilin PulG